MFCQIYDVATGSRLARLHDTERANNYTRNRATFNMSDELVLNDGILWDVDSARSIHKFDKFNPSISGVFHPNGLEIIINSEVVSLHADYSNIKHGCHCDEFSERGINLNFENITVVSAESRLGAVNNVGGA